ncbi:response regulator [Caldilinea sp.]|uniref:response regulator n=1 Tax=Caldilinea sp. TaxID=2293560 RepID=UPI0026244915|nr:response regulator [uncultured Caldilinea sp.]
MTDANTSQSSRAPNKSLILVVDDSPAGRETLQALLFSDAYELHFATDGLQALAMAAQLRPDLILLDVMMPGIDGFEVCRRLRADPELKDIPVIMVTALDDRASRLQGIESGADDFVSKPFDSGELRARVRTVTRLNRYRRLMEERERFEWMIEHADEGYLILDGDVIRYANPRAQTLLNLDEETLATQPSFLALVDKRFNREPQELWRRWPNLWEETQAGTAQSDVNLFLIAPETSTSPVNWLEVTVFGQFHVQESGRLVRVRDVTALKTGLRDMWSFHTMVMHKLNTPMHMMLGSMELLTMNANANISSGEILDLVEMAANGAQRLAAAVNDVIQYATALSTPASIGERFSLGDLPAMAREVAEHLELEQVTVQIEAPQDVSLVLDPREMESILFELLENAKKFHPQHRPTVTLSAALRNERVDLKVQDDGIHLSPDQLNRVWLPYYQGERYFTGEVQGIGLGLPLVASILWEHGGECRISNREDAPGVVIRLAIPIMRNE